jgi:hypothetical protein
MIMPCMIIKPPKLPIRTETKSIILKLLLLRTAIILSLKDPLFSDIKSRKKEKAIATSDPTTQATRFLI